MSAGRKGQPQEGRYRAWECDAGNSMHKRIRMHMCIEYGIVLTASGGRVPPELAARRLISRRVAMATTTATSPVQAPAIAVEPSAATAGHKAIAAVVITGASAVTVGILAWAISTASQLALPL